MANDSTTTPDLLDYSAAAANVARLEELNESQRGRSWSLPIPPEKMSRVPAISSTALWLDQVRVVLASEPGCAVRRANDVSRDRVVAVAVAMTRASTGRTGRDVTASNETLALWAGVSARTVRRARKVLAVLGLAVEMARGRNRLTRLERCLAEAHHGGRQTRASSVWYLTTPREAAMLPRRRSASLGPRSMALKAVQEIPQVNDTGHLPTFRWVCSESLVRNYSPKRAKARAGAKTPRNASKEQPMPRPLHLQHAAAELVSHCIGFDRGQWQRVAHHQWIRLYGRHIGAICDVIAAAGIDTARWSGRAIVGRISEDNRRRGLSWPTIHRPVGFLKTRLSQLDWSVRSPAERSASIVAANVVASSMFTSNRTAGAVTAPHSPAMRQWREAMDDKFPHLARDSKLRDRMSISH